MAEPLYAGVELGGTKCIGVLADAAGGVVEQVSVPTTRPEETLRAIGEVLARWRREHGYRALGLASFGPVDLDPASSRYGWITTTPKPGWRDTDVAGRLGRIAGVPVAFDTDVNGAAKAEGRWGAARGLRDFAYVTVGTGVGVGLIVNGAPTRGFGHAELGHLRVPRLAGDDFPGICPYHGACVEGLASGPAIAARLGGRSAMELPPEAPEWESAVDALAHLCEALVLASAPRRILIGGGVATGHPHLLPRIEARLIEGLAGYVRIPPPPGGGAYVAAPGLGGQAGALGPIALAIEAAGAC